MFNCSLETKFIPPVAVHPFFPFKFVDVNRRPFFPYPFRGRYDQEGRLNGFNLKLGPRVMGSFRLRARLPCRFPLIPA